MKSTVFHALVGYDKTTKRVGVEYDIPARHLDFARRVAGVGVNDPDAALCYRLTPHQARDIAGVIGAQIDVDACNFYMEGFAEPVQAHG